MCASMLGTRRSLDEYRGCVGGEQIEEIAALAKPLRGCRMLHVSALPSRSQLIDAVNALVPLLRAVGIVAEWRTIPSKLHQVEVNRTMNHALDGHFVRWTPRMHANWLDYQAIPAGAFSGGYDFVVIHGAELAGTVDTTPRVGEAAGARWIWHCHADLSKVQPDIWDLLSIYVRQYDRTIMCSYDEGAGFSDRCYATVSPNIDPLSPRNCELPRTFVEMVLRQHRLDPERPIALYVLRNGEDPSVTSCNVDGFLMAKERVQGLQLIVLVQGEENDQLAHTHFRHLVGKLGDCPDARLIPVANGVGNVEINALQRAAAVVLEWSDGAELATGALEAMWKARPLVVGVAAAGRLGVEDGRNVCVAHSAEECGDRIASLIESPLKAQAIGKGASEYVRERFLITEVLVAYLTLLRELARQQR
ncbi:MAG: hypothetical protein HY675_16565 [Chloroflexi bacterium]|nr:hypothetical protein [Chloroflexota bacterium]